MSRPGSVVTIRLGVAALRIPAWGAVSPLVPAAGHSTLNTRTPLSHTIRSRTPALCKLNGRPSVYPVETVSGVSSIPSIREKGRGKRVLPSCIGLFSASSPATPVSTAF